VENDFVPTFSDYFKERRLEGVEVPPELVDANMSGSGSIISPDGLLLTASHTVGPKESVKILHQGNICDAKKILRLKEEDILLLKIRGAQNKFPYLEIEPLEVSIGQRLFCCSFPNPLMLGFEGRFSEATVATDHGLAADRNSIQVTMNSAKGSSGAAMVNDQGRIVAVLQAMLEQSPFYRDVPADISFAVKISSIYSKIAKHLPPLRRGKPFRMREQVISDMLRASVMVFGMNEPSEL